MKKSIFLCEKNLVCMFIALIAVSYSYAQQAEQKPTDVKEQPAVTQQQLKPRPAGYLEDGSSTYGVEEKAIKDDSPLSELKMLRKKYIREVKKRESIEEESRYLKKRVADLESFLQKKDTEIEEFKRKAINAEFKYVALEQKLTNLQIAILRKKMIRESQYPPFYEVRKNDSLWKVSGLKNIYDNNYKWIELFYANKDKVADPDYIYPGMVLKVPRPEMEYEDWTVQGLDLESVKDKVGPVEMKENESAVSGADSKKTENDNSNEESISEPDNSSNDKSKLDQKFINNLIKGQ